MCLIVRKSAEGEKTKSASDSKAGSSSAQLSRKRICSSRSDLLLVEHGKRLQCGETRWEFRKDPKTLVVEIDVIDVENFLCATVGCVLEALSCPHTKELCVSVFEVPTHRVWDIYEVNCGNEVRETKHSVVEKSMRPPSLPPPCSLLLPLLNLPFFSPVFSSLCSCSCSHFQSVRGLLNTTISL